MTSLEKSALRTFVYFDMRAHPLTIEELGGFLVKDAGVNNTDISKMDGALESLVNLGRIEKEGRYYFLSGRKDLVLRRSNIRDLNIMICAKDTL